MFTAGLGEFRIRDLNDDINKLLREKRHWEDRILELGGPDYKVMAKKTCHTDFSFLIIFFQKKGQEDQGAFSFPVSPFGWGVFFGK